MSDYKDFVGNILNRAKDLAESEAVSGVVERVKDAAQNSGISDVFEKGSQRARSFGNATKLAADAAQVDLTGRADVAHLCIGHHH